MFLNYHSLLTCILLLLLSCSVERNLSQQEKNTSTIYLVRHAEKMDDSKDPHLSEEGKQRARSLVTVLKDSAISTVFSTDYKRTRQTAAPVSEAMNLTTELYDPRDNSPLIRKLEMLSGGNALVVGHSNSTPALVNQILGIEKYESLGHEEYNKLFVLKCDASFKCASRVENY